MRAPQWLQKWLGVGLTTPLPSWPWRVHEPYTGAWQQNVSIDRSSAAAHWSVFACVTLIAGDIAKMNARVMDYDTTKRIFVPTFNRPVLRKPNRYQTNTEFFESVVFSLLLNGNCYILKERDERRFVTALYVLDPSRVKPLIAEDGGIYYQLSEDRLSSLDESVVVPAHELIHIRINTFWHPLVGVSPICACGVAAAQGAAIQQNSALFFQNMSRPGGLLTAPGAISNETAERMKSFWDTNYAGSNVGKVAVLGDGLKYEAMTITATDSQMIEQLKFTGEMICATFHVPAYKLGLGQMPTVANAGVLNQSYYDQALHPIIAKIEARLDEGLELEYPQQTWFDTSELLRLDPATRFDSHSKGVAGGWLAPNEARRQEDLVPVTGGDSPFMQQQNWTLAQLANRGAAPDDGSPGGESLSSQERQLQDQRAEIRYMQGLLEANLETATGERKKELENLERTLAERRAQNWAARELIVTKQL